jgi:hypothetical protein
MLRVLIATKQVYYALANDDVVTCVQGIEAMFGGAGGVASALQDVVNGVQRQRPPARPIVAAAFARVKFAG